MPSTQPGTVAGGPAFLGLQLHKAKALGWQWPCHIKPGLTPRLKERLLFTGSSTGQRLSFLSLIAPLKTASVHMVFSEDCTRGWLFKVNVLWMWLLSLGLFDAVKF